MVKPSEKALEKYIKIVIGHPIMDIPRIQIISINTKLLIIELIKLVT